MSLRHQNSAWPFFSDLNGLKWLKYLARYHMSHRWVAGYNERKRNQCIGEH